MQFFFRKTPFYYFHKGLIGLTLLSLLIVVQASTMMVLAASTSNDPLVIVVVDTTHAKGQTCTDTFSTSTHAASGSTLTIPCSPGSVWESKIIHRSQALAQHEDYMLLPSAAKAQEILQLTLQLKDQEKARILQHETTSNVIPFSTACGTDTTAYQTWGYTTYNNVASANITSRVHFYVLSGQLCNQVTIEWAGIHVNSYKWLQCCYTGGHYDHDQYASGWYGVPNGLYDTVDAAGQDYWHGVNNVQPKGYTYETWITDPSCTCYFHWSDIPVK